MESTDNVNNLSNSAEETSVFTGGMLANYFIGLATIVEKSQKTIRYLRCGRVDRTSIPFPSLRDTSEKVLIMIKFKF